MFLFLYFGGGEVRTISVIINTEHCLPLAARKNTANVNGPDTLAKNSNSNELSHFKCTLPLKCTKARTRARSKAKELNTRPGLACDAMLLSDGRGKERPKSISIKVNVCVSVIHCVVCVCVCIPDVNAYYFRLCKYVQAVNNNNNNRKTSKLKRYLKLLPK